MVSLALIFALCTSASAASFKADWVRVIPSTAPGGAAIGSASNPVISRTIATSDGGTPIYQSISPDGHQQVEILSPVSPFGEVITANLTPVIQHDFVYGASTDNFKFTYYNGASISTGLNMIQAHTGAQVNSLSAATTRRTAKYRPGQGTVFFGAGLFSTATAGSNQFFGLGSGESAIGFGTLDDKFGIYHASGNFREVQTLNIGTKSSNDQIASVVLAGSTFYCPVTNGASASATAWEIAYSTDSVYCNFALQAPGWGAEARGSSVVFVAASGGNQSGGMSITFPTSGAGTFTETIQGSLGGTNFIPQASWNMDNYDGSGSSSNPSGFGLDYTKGNVYRISLQYLGFGAIEYGAEDANTGKINPVHRLKFPSTLYSPSLSNPNFGIVVSARNTTNNSVLSTRAGSLSAFLAGQKEELGRQRNFRAYKTGVGTSFTPIINIRNPRMFRGRPNQVELRLREIVVANLGGKGLEFIAIRDPRLSNDAVFIQSDSGTVMEYDTTATSYSAGVIQDGGAVGATNSIVQDLHGNQVSVGPGDIMTIAVRSVATTTDVSVSVQVIEDR